MDEKKPVPENGLNPYQEETWRRQIQLYTSQWCVAINFVQKNVRAAICRTSAPHQMYGDTMAIRSWWIRPGRYGARGARVATANDRARIRAPRCAPLARVGTVYTENARLR